MDGLSFHHQEFETVDTATGICQADTAVCLAAGFQDCTYSNRQLSLSLSLSLTLYWDARPTKRKNL